MDGPPLAVSKQVELKSHLTTPAEIRRRDAYLQIHCAVYQQEQCQISAEASGSTKPQLAGQNARGRAGAQPGLRTRYPRGGTRLRETYHSRCIAVTFLSYMIYRAFESREEKEVFSVFIVRLIITSSRRALCFSTSFRRCFHRLKEDRKRVK